MGHSSASSLTVCGLEGVFAPSMGADAQGCDLAAARLFQKLGGQLTVFTNRSPAAVKAALGRQVTSLPVVCCGGAMLYDLNKTSLFQARTMTMQASRSVLHFALEELNRAGVVGVDAHGNTCLLRASREAQMFLNREGGTYQLLPPEEAGAEWCKLAICGSPKENTRMQNFLQDRPDLPIRVLHQDVFSIELVAAQINAQEVMCALCSMAGCVQQQTTAIVSQTKDMEWAAHAGMILAMGDAPEEIRRQCHGTLGTYRSGGLGEYLYRKAKAMQESK